MNEVISSRHEDRQQGAGYKLRQLLKAFEAQSEPTRVRTLSLLMERECCVCEIMQALDISQSRASCNLGILQNAGFLKVRLDTNQR